MVQNARCDHGYCSSPGSIVSAIYEKYTRDLNCLLHKDALMLAQNLTNGAAGWYFDSNLQVNLSGTSSHRSDTKTSLYKMRLD